MRCSFQGILGLKALRGAGLCKFQKFRLKPMWIRDVY